MRTNEFKPLIEDDKEYARRKAKPLAIAGLIFFLFFFVAYYSYYNEILELLNIGETAKDSFMKKEVVGMIDLADGITILIGKIVVILAPVIPLTLFLIYLGKTKVNYMLERSN